MCEEYKQFTIDEEDPDTALEMLEQADGQHRQSKYLREKLEELAKESVVLKFFYDSHKSWDAALFELMFWARGISGCKRFEEFLYVYGKNGRNAKGSRILLLMEAFGEARSGGYTCVQHSSLFTKPMEANKCDEATAAAVGCRLLVADEAGQNKSDEGAKPMVYEATTVKKFCDVAGTPFPFQKKYGEQEDCTVSWALMMYGNVVPEMRNADPAFKRRPSLMEISTEFVSVDKYDEHNKLHNIADERFKNREFLAKMVPELWQWLRRLLPALYVDKSASRLTPVPASVKGFTDESLGTADLSEKTAVFKEIVQEFLDKCCIMQLKPGRGKSSNMSAIVPPKVEDVDSRFKEWYGGRTSPWTSLQQSGFTKGGYNGVWCYQFDKKLLMLNPEAPKVRESLHERAASCGGVSNIRSFEHSNLPETPVLPGLDPLRNSKPT